MKRNLLAAILFIVVLICVAGAVYLRWEKTQQQEVVKPSLSEYVEPVGSYMNPIKSLSGEIYTQTDEESGVSLELPLEFKQAFNNSTLASNTVYFERNKENDSDDMTYQFYIDFQFLDKNKIATDRDFYSYEDVVFPRIKNLSVGESYTYSRFSKERKREMFGENYSNDMYTGDHIYTRLPDVNLWSVYEGKYYEPEPSYAYKATVETDTHFLTISYGVTFLPPESEQEKIIGLNLSSYRSILKSVRGI